LEYQGLFYFTKRTGIKMEIMVTNTIPSTDGSVDSKELELFRAYVGDSDITHDVKKAGEGSFV